MPKGIQSADGARAGTAATISSSRLEGASRRVEVEHHARGVVFEAAEPLHREVARQAHKGVGGRLRGGQG